jgi:protein lifeguard
LFVAIICLFGFGLFAIIFRSEVLYVLYSSIGALVFSLYLVLDTQLLLGGKHKYQISPEDYVIAALNIYVDVINIFLMLLSLTSLAN